MDVERGGIKYKEKWRIFIDVIILFAKKHFEKYIWTTKREIFMFINCVFYSKTSFILFCEWKIILIDCVILYFPILLSYQFWRFCCKSLLMISALHFVYQTLVNHLLFTVFIYSLLEHFSFVCNHLVGLQLNESIGRLINSYKVYYSLILDGLGNICKGMETVHWRYVYCDRAPSRSRFSRGGSLIVG